MRRRSNSLRVVAALLLGVHLAGCIKTWQPSPIGPTETVATNPDRVFELPTSLPDPPGVDPRENPL